MNKDTHWKFRPQGQAIHADGIPLDDLRQERKEEGDAERERRLLCLERYYAEHGHLGRPGEPQKTDILHALAEGERLLESGAPAPEQPRTAVAGRPRNQPQPACIRCEKLPRTNHREDGLCSNCRAQVGEAQKRREATERKLREIADGSRLACSMCSRTTPAASASGWIASGKTLCWVCRQKPGALLETDSCDTALSGQQAG